MMLLRCLCGEDIVFGLLLFLVRKEIVYFATRFFFPFLLSLSVSLLLDSQRIQIEWIILYWR